MSSVLGCNAEYESRHYERGESKDCDLHRNDEELESFLVARQVSSEMETIMLGCRHTIQIALRTRLGSGNTSGPKENRQSTAPRFENNSPLEHDIREQRQHERQTISDS